MNTVVPSVAFEREQARRRRNLLELIGIAAPRRRELDDGFNGQRRIGSWHWRCRCGSCLQYTRAFACGRGCALDAWAASVSDRLVPWPWKSSLWCFLSYVADLVRDLRLDQAKILNSWRFASRISADLLRQLGDGR